MHDITLHGKQMYVTIITNQDTEACADYQQDEDIPEMSDEDIKELLEVAPETGEDEDVDADQWKVMEGGKAHG